MALSLGEVFAILAFVAQVVQILSDWAQVHYRHHYLDRAQLDLHVGDEARVGDGYRDGANALGG